MEKHQAIDPKTPQDTGPLAPDSSITQGQFVPKGIDEGIWAWDIPNNRIYWSSRIYGMLGIPQQSAPLTIETILAWVHPEDREPLENSIQTSLCTGASFEATFKMGYHSAAYRSLQLLGRTYCDKKRKPIRMSGLVVDVTEQKKAEDSIQKAGRSQAFERQAERITELEGVTLAQRRDIAARKVIQTELKKSLKREKLIKHLIQLMSRSFEVDKILKIATQEIGSFLGVDRCRVIQYQGEEGIKELQLSAQYSRSEDLPALQDEEILWTLMEFLKTQPKKAHPLVFSNVAGPEQFPSSIKSHLKSHGIQSALILEIKYRSIPFGWLSLHQCAHPHVWTEQEVDFLEILAAHIGAALYQADLYQQERQAKQEAEAANRQKTKILSFVSHDFKNPLDSILRFVGILQKDQSDSLSEKHREFVSYIAEGVTHLRYMVTDILDKARLEEGRMTPILEPLEITLFIDELRPIFTSMAAQRNVEVSIEIPPSLTIFKADPTHLRQTLINLVSNAIKYNRVNGKVFLQFYVSDDAKFIMIEVRDTGIGIPADKIPSLFTEYYRVNLSQPNLIEGTGLGLAFVKKLVELQGGQLTVDSEVGVGSTFKVMLPKVK